MAGKTRKNQECNSASIVETRLREKLERLKRRVGIGHEIHVKWVPSATKFKNGKQLDEEVIRDTILIYTEDPDEASELVCHGFVEWILNQHTKPYRQLINKLIALFEEQQYERKEKIVNALAELLKQRVEIAFEC